MSTNYCQYSNFKVSNHKFELPLNYSNNDSETITVFVREIINLDKEKENQPYLIFFQGGPGYQSPRPISISGWIKRACEDYKVLLIDQRGTGLSTPICSRSFEGRSDQEIADYLTHFRADNIVRDAEEIRKIIIGDDRWSILGQSFGGFCAMHYLSFYQDSLDKVYITGGIPPLDAHPDDIYRRTYKRVLDKNNLFYNTFPQAINRVSRIADYLIDNEVYLPNGDLLSIQRFQQLGLNLGFSDGMPMLNFLFEEAFNDKKISYLFLKNILSIQTFDTNPIFTVLHEACYAQNFATNWSANRILDEFKDFRLYNNKKLFFTGEMLYPWMLDDYQELRVFKNAANIIAEKKDWPKLYDEKTLINNKVPIAAAVYTNDMYVDRDYSISLANIIPNINIWETNEYEHNALRSDGKKVLDLLFERIK